jgi:hypothetical protein
MGVWNGFGWLRMGTSCDHGYELSCIGATELVNHCLLPYDSCSIPHDQIFVSKSVLEVLLSLFIRMLGKYQFSNWP